MPVTAKEIRTAMNRIAPLEHAEEWDNVGELIRGSRDRVRRLCLTIDFTEPVLQEAVEQKCDMVIAYHPTIFNPIKRLGAVVSTERVILGTARAGIHLYSPHTALDAAIGGTNDWLADILGPGDRRALVPAKSSGESDLCKIVTFCPSEATDRIRDGLAAVGAGIIGNYKRCSFEIAGAGTFHGNAESDPQVGSSGRLERIGETRLEMVCPSDALPGAIRALASFHPYEEPPIEIYTLEPVPLRESGPGRKVVLDRARSLKGIADSIKSRTEVSEVRIARSHERPRQHKIIGLCAGSGGALLDDAIAQGCTVFVTGEMSHHDILKAQSSGCTVILAGHTETERCYLPVLSAKLKQELGDACPKVLISRQDRSPLRKG